jgi:hypothetical protein
MLMENIVAFDPETGTVVGASGLLLVDLNDLAKALNASVDEVTEMLCDEDDDAQSAAMDVGTPVKFRRKPVSL